MTASVSIQPWAAGEDADALSELLAAQLPDTDRLFVEICSEGVLELAVRRGRFTWRGSLSHDLIRYAAVPDWFAKILGESYTETNSETNKALQ